MKSVLVITPCSKQAIPTHGVFIAEALRRAGFRVGILTKARSGLGRLLDVTARCPVVIPRYDSVLVNVYGERAFLYESLAIIAGRLWDARTVVLVHNGRMPEFVRRWPLWVSVVLSCADLVMTPHDFLRTELSRLGLRVDGTIPNFIDLKRYEYRERSMLDPRFLYLRGMHPYYNPEMAIRAFRLIQDRYPEASLTMAGQEGKQSRTCRKLVRALNLRNVSFVGLLPHDEIPGLADRHDIHLHTSGVDNMPVSIIEMWACGLPTIGTDIGGMPYLMRNGIDGILVRSGDHEAMAKACLQLLSDHGLSRRLSRNGRDRAEAFTWDKIIPLWEHALTGSMSSARVKLQPKSSEPV